ncbi:General vesicular transport factor, partial [Intoshia linei]
AGLDPKQTFKNADAVDDTKIDGDNRETDLERKRLKRRLKQKEKSYLERLHRWELREERKSREYNRDMEKSIFKKKEVLRKKKKMERMLESYDDIKDDPYNYEGISYEAKLRAMKIEEEEDRQDRLREQDEIEQEKELKLKKKLEAVEVEPIVEPIDIKPVPEPVDEIEIKPEPEPENESNTDQVLDIEKYANQPINIATVTKPKIENSVLFEEEEEENALHKKKMPKLEEIEYEPNEKVIGTGNMYHIESNTNRVDYHNAGPDEKKRIVLKFVERIPSDKDKLFGYYIDWHYVTDGHVLSKIKPWINKKLTELLGDEEPVLENFIAQKLKDQTTPVSIVRDLFPILDDDAEIFVIKMWRLLIYEIFAEQNGINKNWYLYKAKSHLCPILIHELNCILCLNNGNFRASDNDQDTSHQTISTLCEKFRSSSNLQDCRDCLRSIKLLSKDYPILVGNICLRPILDAIHEDKNDSECLLYSLETLLNICVPILHVDATESKIIDKDSDDFDTTNEEIKKESILKNDQVNAAKRFIQEISTKNRDLMISLDVITDMNYRVRYAATKLLLVICKIKRLEIQNAIIEYPQGINRLVDGLSDSHEMVRNEIILLLIELNCENGIIQKQIAFQGAFDTLFSIAESDDEKSVLVEDCVILITMLLKNNNSNQIFFRETGYISKLLPLFKSQILESGSENSNWPSQQISNLRCIFDLICEMVSVSNVREQSRLAQNAVYSCGLLAELSSFIVSSGVPNYIEAHAIKAIGNIVRSNKINQMYMVSLVAPTKPPKHTILILLISMVHDRQSLELRWSVLYFFECFLRHNEPQQLLIANELIQKYSKGFSQSDKDNSIGIGTLLVGCLSSFDCVSSWFSAMALSAAIMSNYQAKELMMKVNFSSGVASKPSSLFLHSCRILLESNVYHTKIGICILIIEWLYDFPPVASLLLSQPDFILYVTSSIWENECDLLHNTFKALSAYLLGCIHFYSIPESNSTQRDLLKSTICNKIGPSYLINKIKYLYDNNDFQNTLNGSNSDIQCDSLPQFSINFVLNFIRKEPIISSHILNIQDSHSQMKPDQISIPHANQSTNENDFKYRQQINMLNSEITRLKSSFNQDVMIQEFDKLKIENEEMKTKLQNLMSHSMPSQQIYTEQNNVEVDKLKLEIESLKNEHDDLLVLLADQDEIIEELKAKI